MPTQPHSDMAFSERRRLQPTRRNPLPRLCPDALLAHRVPVEKANPEVLLDVDGDPPADRAGLVPVWPPVPIKD